jgi:hypothetical protein
LGMRLFDLNSRIDSQFGTLLKLPGAYKGIVLHRRPNREMEP